MPVSVIVEKHNIKGAIDETNVIRPIDQFVVIQDKVSMENIVFHTVVIKTIKRAHTT